MLFDHGLIDDASCVFCRDGRQTTDHFMVACPFSRLVLRESLKQVKLSPPRTDWRQGMVRVVRGRTALAKARRKCLAATVYLLWHERNCRVFGSRRNEPEMLVRLIVGSLSSGHNT
ncbi:hypothetical protein Dimus_034662 [Dionaea muscipula]